MRRPTAHSTSAVVLLLAIIVGDVAFDNVILLSFTVVPPLLSAALGTVRQTVWMAGWSTAAAVVLGVPDQEFATLDHTIRVAAVVVGSGFAVYVALVRADREAQLTRLALQDPLTGLVNRTVLHDRLAQLLRRRDDRGVLAVMFLDLDGFKGINDTLGHAAGDAVLVHVARQLESTVRDADTVARFAGDEFVVLCPDLPGEQEAEATAHRLLEALHQPMPWPAGPVTITASIGLATSPAPHATDEAEHLLRAADAAMYEAKQVGPGRWATAAL